MSYLFVLDCYHGLGMESGAIPDHDIYSSKLGQDNPFTYTGRLNSPYPHCYTKNYDGYFNVRFHDLHWIVAIAVQGFNKDGIHGVLLRLGVATKLATSESGITEYDNQYTVSIYIVYRPSIYKCCSGFHVFIKILDCYRKCARSYLCPEPQKLIGMSCIIFTNFIVLHHPNLL